MQSSVTKRSKQFVALVLAIVAAQVTMSITMASGGTWDYAGYGSGSEVVNFNCGNNNECDGTCQWRDYTYLKCTVGTADCVPGAKTYVGDPYYGSCREYWIGTNCYCAKNQS